MLANTSRHVLIVKTLVGAPRIALWDVPVLASATEVKLRDFGRGTEIMPKMLDLFY